MWGTAVTKVMTIDAVAVRSRSFPLVLTTVNEVLRVEGFISTGILGMTPNMANMVVGSLKHVSHHFSLALLKIAITIHGKEINFKKWSSVVLDFIVSNYFAVIVFWDSVYYVLWLFWNSRRSTCFRLLSAGINHTQLRLFFKLDS